MLFLLSNGFYFLKTNWFKWKGRRQNAEGRSFNHLEVTDNRQESNPFNHPDEDQDLKDSNL